MYEYVLNDPLNLIDPFGLAHWELGPDGQRHFVGDKDGEYNRDLNAHWNAKNKVWDFSSTPRAQTHLEILFFSPVISLRHPFGLLTHVAYNINGTAHTWEDGGWRHLSMKDYMRENNYRDAVGYVLGDENDPNWAEDMANEILKFNGDGETPVPKNLEARPLWP
jgi:hypothetical protein